jgi:biopolymer transport protein ExbD
VAGWRLAKADGSDQRRDLSLAQVCGLLEQGAYGPEDLVASPTQDVLRPIRLFASLQRFLSPAAPAIPAAPAAVEPPTPRPPPQPSPPRASDAAGPAGLVHVARRRLAAALADSELEIAPMIDVVFQLLIFFMVCSVLNKTHGVKVPAAESGDRLDPASALVVGVRPAAESGDSQDQIFYDFKDQRVDGLSPDEVASRAAAQTKETPGLQVVIKADGQAVYRTVRELVAALNKRHIHSVTGVREKE